MNKLYIPILASALALCTLLSAGCANENSVETSAVQTETTATPPLSTTIVTTVAKPASTEPVTENTTEISTETKTIQPEQNSREDIPKEYFIEGVPIIEQNPDFPTGCESVSACMVLQYLGYDVTPDEFISLHLPKDDNFYHKNGICYGPDPYDVFVGDPTNDRSYGCMSPVISKALDSYFGNNEWGCVVEKGTLNTLCEKYISKGIPTLVWVSMEMDIPRPGDIWTLPDGNEYQWLAGEHCMVLLGYDETHYYFNDPYNGETIGYERELSEQRFAAFESQAIVIY